MSAKQPVLLCILDGWGVSSSTSPQDTGNAIALSHTPHYTSLWQHFPHTTLQASQEWVGLPQGQMGNSEVGHMAMGCGRIFLQDLVRIHKSLGENFLETNHDVQALMTELKESPNFCHLIGLFSEGGVHSHQDHFVTIAKHLEHHKIPTWCHLIADGRDTSPKKFLKDVEDFDAFLEKAQFCRLATFMGRFYAMDRDARWDRTQKAYQAMIQGKGHKFTSLKLAVETQYHQNLTDEFFIPHVHAQYSRAQKNDSLWIVNFRADRVRQLALAMVDPEFNFFPREFLTWSKKLGMCEYSQHLNTFLTPLFPKEKTPHSLGEVVSSHHLKQFRIAETEKYAHVTFFFNGGREVPFQGEERCLIPSPQVTTYDLKPEMSAEAITDKVVEVLASKDYTFVVVNYANPDMVGHTGQLQATIKAIEFIDVCLGRLCESAKKNGYAMIVTSDHGNAEQLFDSHHIPQTSHTCHPVPFILAHSPYLKLKEFTKTPDLSDIAPTVLKLLGLPKPQEMSGHSLI